jgi:ABC-type multidrug transport system ATPase subunit
MSPIHAALALLLLIAGAAYAMEDDISPICPPYADVPWYDDRASFLPFTWCKSGDVGRVASPYDFDVPSWANNVSCSENGICKNLQQVELFDIDSLAYTAATFVSNPTEIIIRQSTILSNPTNSSFFIGAPIRSFRLIRAADREFKGFLVLLRDGRWLEALAESHFDGSAPVHMSSLRDLSSIYSNVFPGGAKINNAVAFVGDDLKIYYAVSAVLASSSSDRFISFARYDYDQLSKPIGYVNVTNGPDSLELEEFRQNGKDEGIIRTLIVLHGGRHVHLIRPISESDQTDPFQPIFVEFDWQDEKAPSAFYAAPSNARLWHISLFSESHTRDGQAVPMVWMTTVEDSPGSDGRNRSIMTLFMYPEFGAGWNETGQSAVPILDPLNQGPLHCSWRLNWFTGGQCVSRQQQILFEETDVIIPAVAARTIPKTKWLTNFFPPGDYFSDWSTDAYTAIFFVERSFLHVYGVQPVINETLLTKIESMNNFTLLGTANRLAVAENGLHVLPVVQKYEWELASINRFAEICELVSKEEIPSPIIDNPSLEPALWKLVDESLEAWRVPCSGGFRRVAATDFIQYLSLCPIGSFCQSTVNRLVGGVYPGFYAPRPLSMQICPPGSYCPFGILRECPPGFICPANMTLLPTPCPIESLMHGKTCYGAGLTEPIPAPDGTIPIYAQAAPMPAPPGLYATHDPNTGFIGMSTCQEGEYCPLARDEAEDRRCPPGTFCSDPTVIVPTHCRIDPQDNYCSYCPPGSTSDQPCPAGYYCPAPAIRLLCVAPYHCPAGTLAPSLCPAGSYCPTPAERHICPKNYYCTLGTVVPSPCAILSYCPEGTKNNSANFILALVFVLVIALLVTVWRVLENRITKKRAQRSQMMQDAEKLLARSRLQKQAQGANGSGMSLEEEVEDDDDSDTDALLGKSSINNDYDENSPAALAALIHQDLNSRMPELPFRVDITFKELGLKIKGTEKKVLDGVTGTIRSGRVTAVMGPSGAGKTTFMSTLANKAHYGDRTGTILLNGEKGDLTSIQKLVGFVPQDDVMLRELSVTEILTFNAKMRLPSDMSEEQVNAIVRRSIRLLGLYDIRHELIGDETKRGISGGQRKRVNIGMELVAQPAVLFLDEPTSGLDSSASLDVCAILRRVAEEAGMTVISVIHQPRYDIFTMFHDVLLLGKGGRTVYLGPTKDAVAYFETLGFEMPLHCNPADFLIDVVAGSVPRKGYPEYVKEDLFALWSEYQKSHKNSDFATDVDTDSEYLDDSDSPTSPPSIKLVDPDRAPDFVVPPEGIRTTSSFFHQFWWFFVRSLVQQKRNWISILTDVILVVVSAITFGIVFLDSHYIGPPPSSVCALMPVAGLQERCALPIDDPFPQIALMTTIGLALPAAMAALRVFGNERVVFWRESSVGANTASYYLGKEFGFMPSSFLLPLLYAGVFYNFTVPRMNFGLLYMIFLATWWAATGLALVVSILVPPTLATISTVVVVFGMSMFSGVRPTLLELKKMWPPFSLISYVSFFRWLTEAYYISEIYQWRNLYDISTGLKAFNYALDHFPLCIGLVLGMGLAFRIIALILLQVMHLDQRR